MSISGVEKSLSGAEKVAILIRLLDEQSINSLLSQLGEAEIREVSRALMSLGQVPSEVVEKVLLEFIWRVNESFNVVGNRDLAFNMLQNSLGAERANKIMEDVTDNSKISVWEHLERMESQELASFLRKEHPQTVAAILLMLSPAKSAAIIANMKKDYAFEIVKRILGIEDLSSNSINYLEKALRRQFSDKLFGDSERKKNNIQVLADILDVLNSSTRGDVGGGDAILHKIATFDQGAAENIKKMMFSFSDIADLDHVSIQAILNNLDDKSVLVVALKGASEAIRSVFTSAMSQRAAKLLMEEIATVNATSASEIMAAQRTIIGKVKELINNGVINV